MLSNRGAGFMGLFVECPTGFLGMAAGSSFLGTHLCPTMALHAFQLANQKLEALRVFPAEARLTVYRLCQCVNMID